jgi:hypothetical protein
VCVCVRARTCMRVYAYVHACVCAGVRVCVFGCTKEVLRSWKKLVIRHKPENFIIVIVNVSPLFYIIRGTPVIPLGKLSAPKR